MIEPLLSIFPIFRQVTACATDLLPASQPGTILHFKKVCNGNSTYTYHLPCLFNEAMTQANSQSPQLPIDSPERRRLPPLLRRAWFSLNQAFRRRLSHLEITPDQFTVLRTLLESPSQGINQRELGVLMTSDPNTVASLLERMEKAGLIERQADENDRRAYRLRLQAKGKRLYHEARQIAVALQSEILSVLPEQKREEFLEQLALVADSCRVTATIRPKPRRS
jgi:DNA-binding MarR family transcriptional regulator